jgi:hypothetical protein
MEQVHQELGSSDQKNDTPGRPTGESYIIIKEKTMDEHTMPEQDLSEELLQQVTGGCKGCNRDWVKIDDHDISYKIHTSLADLAEANGHEDLQDFHMEKAFFYMEKGDEARSRIAQRKATPGHVIIPERQPPPGRRWIM